MNIIKAIVLALLPFMLPACSPAVPEGETAQIPYDSLRNGDIVFRRGCSYTSYIVLANDDNHDYSHIGIVQKSDSGWCVIHSVNDEPDHPTDFDRVKIEKIERFFSPSRATKGEIMHSWLNDSVASIISQQAIQLLKDSVRFDASFNTEEHSELYCTEFIYFLYKNIGEDITEGRRTPVGILCFPNEMIFPSDIYKNKRLKSFCKF
ncbi:MAG: hypothetical protein IJ436_01585 [Bacteroidaceae bacterium]|nr:hypothetical protein [Bacteroidaceae bacterium]